MAISQGDLTGTKNGTNTVFTIPVTPIASSQQIIFNGSTLKPVGSFSAAPARNMEYTIVGTTVTVGLAPKSTDTLWYICDV